MEISHEAGNTDSTDNHVNSTILCIMLTISKYLEKVYILAYMVMFGDWYEMKQFLKHLSEWDSTELSKLKLWDNVKSTI